MPSKSRFWYTHHDGLSLLHVTSNDPRRDGQEDLAIFDSDVFIGFIGCEWRVRHGRIENQYGKSFLSTIAPLYKLGSIQIEPNCDFTRNNFKKRSGSGGNVEALKKYMSNPNWKENHYNKRFEVENFGFTKFKKKSEWCELELMTDAGVPITIKVNKCLAQYVPKKVVYRPQRNNPLYLWPTKEQAKREKHGNDRRHGPLLSEFLIKKVTPISQRGIRRSDQFDFRVNYVNNRYACAIAASCTYTNVADGVLLAVTYPTGYGRLWTERAKNVYPDAHECFGEGEERIGYYLLDKEHIDKIKEYDWLMGMNGDSVYTSWFEEGSVETNKYQLPKLVAKLNGVEVGKRVESSRMNHLYKKAIEDGEKGFERRAKFENTIMSDAKGNQKTYTKGRIRKFHRFHCDKYVAIPELNVTALDVRFQSIRIGGAAK